MTPWMKIGGGGGSFFSSFFLSPSFSIARAENGLEEINEEEEVDGPGTASLWSVEGEDCEVSGEDGLVMTGVLAGTRLAGVLMVSGDGLELRLFLPILWSRASNY